MTGLTVAQVLSQTFNGRVEWGVPGSYLKILSAAANLQLEAFKGGVLVLLAPTVKAGFYQRVEFDRIVVTNTGSQLTEILVAPDQGGSDAFTANSVITSPLASDGAAVQRIAVARFSDAITDNNAAFMGYGSQGGAAANNAHVQYKNPAASGKTAYCDGVTVSSGAGIEVISLATFDTDLTTDGGAVISKALGGAAGVGHVRSQNNATLLGTTFMAITTPGSQTIDIPLDPPVKLAAGKGLIARSEVQNVTLLAAFRVREY